MSAENGDFPVYVTSEEVVAAVLPMQEHRLPLSNLDLLLPPVDVGVFLATRNLFSHPQQPWRIVAPTK